MKIAFPTAGDNLNSVIEDVFGRAKSFLIFDTETKEIKIIDNTANLSAAHGVGIKSAETVSKAGIDVMVCMNCGPKAQDVLESADVKIIVTDESTISKAIEKHNLNKV